MKIHIYLVEIALALATASAFAPHTHFSFRIISLIQSSHQDLYDSEEEAAFDAHDLSDAGMEAAAMERAVMMANNLKLPKKTETKTKADQGTKEKVRTEANIQPSGDHQNLYEAEEEAAFDAHDLSDAGMEAAAMERAIMMANNLLRKKREELKDKTESAKKIESEYILVKQATKDLVKLFKSYEADPSKFRKEFASKGKDEISLAIEMLEKVIAETSEEILELQREEDNTFANFLDALHKEEVAEALLARLKAQEAGALDSLNLVEEFDGDYEVNERKRDMSSFHFMKEKEEIEKDLKNEALDDENIYLTKEYEGKKSLQELKQKERDLKADLRSIQEIVREQLRREWAVEGN
eukprot:CAMPEP_0176493872 /NCGR_PEP_ID=MMETSP0200_2-20121128/9777_1 /TAXON_ID=947934 /ORGANISM="Chaetoceros sp., Strain GSL56" /LENGTH=353 /DNA_ID=CAMNT_0017891557 /DNA_START=1209 /DNA_END=2267 /DNA_ORIENTATION=+